MAATALARADKASQRRLTGREKVAVLCMALGSEAAAKITQRLSPEEAESISFEIARLESVPVDLTENVLLEWVEVSLALDLYPKKSRDVVLLAIAGHAERLMRRIWSDPFASGAKLIAELGCAQGNASQDQLRSLHVVRSSPDDTDP